MESTPQGCFHEANFVDKNGSLKTIRLPVVQELVRQGLKNLPDGFSIASPDPSLMTHEPIVIPAIDVEKLQVGSDPKDRAEELAKLACGAKEWGLFLIKNHGREESLLDEVKNVTKGFFGLSFEEKKASVGTYMSKDNMGYGRNFMEANDHQMVDWVDRLTMKAAPKEAIDGLNVWPNRPPNFRKTLEEYVEQGRKVCDELMKALAEALDLERASFFQYDVKQTDITIKVNYYPPCPRPDQALGLPAHSDGTNLTLLMQCGATNGLQAFKNNKWGTVVWSQNDLLVNVGDLVEILSNGRYKSAWHRVVTQLEEERISIGLFYRAPPTAVIEPVGDYEGGGFKKVVVSEYLSELYKSRTIPTIKPPLKYGPKPRNYKIHSKNFIYPPPYTNFAQKPNFWVVYQNYPSPPLSPPHLRIHFFSHLSLSHLSTLILPLLSLSHNFLSLVLALSLSLVLPQPTQNQ